MLMTHPVMSAEQAHAYEQQLLYRRDLQWEALENAGRRVGHLLYRDFHELANWPRQARILLLVGKGHNGGDALMAGVELRSRLPESQIYVLPTAPREDWRGLTQRAYEELEATGPVYEVNTPTAANYLFDACIDGALGMRSRPTLKDDLRETLLMLNEHPHIGVRAAVDLPSGLGDNDAFRADFTYATGIVKEPVLDPDQAAYVGRLRYADIGFFEPSIASQAPETSVRVCADVMLRPWLKMRPPGDDKRSYGHLLVLAGHRTMPGALLMNVRTALRSGTGLVTAFAAESVAPALAAAAPEAMWVPFPETPDGGLALEGRHLVERKVPRATALLMGSGMGDDEETQALRDSLIETVPV
ncbi:MAG: NAD(P)H-hydrate epimerase, partial [Opitutales bacterium]